MRIEPSRRDPSPYISPTMSAPEASDVELHSTVSSPANVDDERSFLLHDEVELHSSVSSPAIVDDDERSFLRHDFPSISEAVRSGFYFTNTLDIPIMISLSMLKPVYVLKVEPGETSYLSCQRTVFDLHVQPWVVGCDKRFTKNPHIFRRNPMSRCQDQSPTKALFGDVLLGVVTIFAHVHPICLAIRGGLLAHTWAGGEKGVWGGVIVDAFANGSTVVITGKKEKDGKVLKIKAEVVTNKGKELKGKDKTA
jgi:hypothetical protein